MAVTTYAQWLADGSPIRPAVCIADWIVTMRKYGYVCGFYPDLRHLKASPPEDHTPYSHTPWPGPQPYPYSMASDLMPPMKPGMVPLAKIGAQMVADKKAGKPGTEWIKYINWTDANGNVWHDQWEPNWLRSHSTDTGHLHVSARTDWVNKHTTYDPVAEILGVPMSGHLPNDLAHSVFTGYFTSDEKLQPAYVYLLKAATAADKVDALAKAVADLTAMVAKLTPPPAP